MTLHYFLNTARKGLLILLSGLLLQACSSDDPETLEQTWITWVQNNYQEISSLTSDDYGDLQFLNQTLEDTRIVQLGESGHGVAEFNKVKVRLIKFLHQEMDFDVIAFESSVAECFQANRNAAAFTSQEMMLESIFGVWYTAEVLELFDYIKETQQTDRPLILAGVDIQLSSLKGNGDRAAFLFEFVSKIDPDYAQVVLDKEIAFNERRFEGFESYQKYVDENSTELIQHYEDLYQFIVQNFNQFEAACADEPLLPHFALQAVWSLGQYIEGLSIIQDRSAYTLIRDRGMADNLDFLADIAYPNKKIMLWAHNAHIRHRNEDVVYQGTTSANNEKAMGSWISERRSNELYTIGLLMNKGQAAHNNREIYTVEPATGTSSEALLKIPQLDIFIDLKNDVFSEGSEWMHTERVAREWGLNDDKMVLKDQYDGIIFINEVTPPEYLRY